MMNISDARDCAFEAFVTNLGKYNEGFFGGRMGEVSRNQ